ncbi:sugar ABC transporter permease [Promicromonospora sp. NPDC060271]|uniref:sugar ABC transporter permease n=1 Tax=Promicromonospora sp. NPDC060271 TaxID=3347089 RepID=UPI00365B0E20
MSTTIPPARPAAPPRRVAPARRTTPARWFSDLGWRHLVGVLAVVYAGFPLVYVVSASLADGGTLTGSNDLFAAVSGANYVALGGTKFWTWMANTLVVAVATGVGTVLMGAAAAYAFSRFRFSGRRVGLTALLVIQMFPQMLAFVAIFLLLISLGNVVPVLGLDSKLSLICVYLGGALGVNTFLMYGFFNTVPREIDEAAKIDGASHAQIYWTIVLRLTAPILAVVGLLSFISTFGEFIIARVLLQSEENWTLAVGLYGWVSSLQDANWGLFTAGAVVSAVPVLALFLFLQKYIVGGLTAGSVKG